MKQWGHAGADSFPLRPREQHGGFKAINKRCSKDLQAVVDGYCKFWVKENPPGELVEKLTKPVLIFERFCIPYGGYASIDKISPIADILIMVDDLNLTGRKEAYDIIMEKIGSQFFVYVEAKKYLEKHFSFIHTCDSKTIEAINLPVTDFTLAII